MMHEHLSEEELSIKEKSFEEWVVQLMGTLATNRYARVKFYPYRTAKSFDELFVAERDSMRPLEYILAIKAGVTPDNRSIYEVYNGSQTYYIFCRDDICLVGKAIIKW